MYHYKLVKNNDGYDLIIYLNQNSEFAAEFNNDKIQNNNHIKSFYQSIKTRYPKLLINSVKIVLSGVILATIPISIIDVQAQTTDIKSNQQVNNQMYTTKSGDSLWSIARQFNISVNDLKKANQLETDIIPVGKQLAIPSANSSSIYMTVDYTVQPNDSLWTIANKYDVSIDQIKNANNLKTDVLQIGTVLQIPKSIAIPGNNIPEIRQSTTYTVQPNDNLWSIANRFNVTIDQIRNTNNLKTDVLQIGTVLIIPNATPDANVPEIVQPITYIVQPYDSLWSIANRYNASIEQIRNINNLKTDVLQIGSVLLIPNTTAIPESNVPDVSKPITYTVQANDSLWSIANRYDVSIDQIRNTNNLKTDVLQIGQNLIIPPSNNIDNNESSTEVKDILYRVKVGDTIDSIANSYNISPQRIIEANNLSSRNIIDNQALIIPLSNTTYASTISPTTYVVQSGDDLWKISKRFAVSINSIRQASNLQSDNLTIGQKLIIPTTINSSEHNRETLEWLIEAQYNMTPTSVFHDVTVRNQEYWAKATKEQIGYYANPDNFVNDEILKYQFLVLNYHPEIHNTQLNNFLNNRGIFNGHGSTFNRAASNHNVSQVYLVSHAMLETNNGTTPLARGILVNEVDGKPVTPRVVYNMYGINAFDSNPNKYGAEYAYKQQWFSVEDAIIGGAKWISDNYINHPTYQQNTLYKMRWNPTSTGVHQYSTDVAWAYNQTFNIYSLLSSYQNIYYQFDVPVFNEYIKI